MAIAEYSVRNRTVSWMVLLLLIVGGSYAFVELGRLEDPPFTRKDAMIISAYPGATAEEVELELSYPLETAIRQLAEVHTVRSTSRAGLSQIIVEMDKEMPQHKVDQMWDRLRRKVADVAGSLPSGATAPRVYDDYGDVFGITLMVSGENYEFSELKHYVDVLKRELEMLDGVGRVNLFGEQQEQIFVEISLEKLAALNLDMHRVVGFLTQQNSVLDAGRVTVNGEFMHLRLAGLEMEIDPIVHGRDSGQLIRLSDVATIHRGYQEIPAHLIRMNGQEALALGISFADGVNVVDVGHRIDQRLAELRPYRPAGINVESLYNQPHEVNKSIRIFLVNVGTSVLVVIGALLLTMGWRAGLVVGLTLLLTVLGTFILMKVDGWQLHRLSLGALIIALGMLVDNAIVVVEGAMVGVTRGVSKREACFRVVRQTRWPLLAATVIAVLAFTPFGLSDQDSGQIMKPMFWVLTYSLLLSWILAVSITPFLADLLLRDVQPGVDGQDDPYRGWTYSLYRKILDAALRFRKTVIVLMVLALAISVGGLGQVKKAFFTPSNTPIFYMDMWLPYGTDIRATLAEVEKAEQWVAGLDGVEFVAASVGRGAPRFFMTYLPEQSYENFAQLQVRADSPGRVRELMHEVELGMYQRFPRVNHQMRHMVFGPPARSEIQARFRGPDPEVLRDLGARAAAVIRADDAARSVYLDWQERNKELAPLVNEPEARRLGISNEEIAGNLKIAFGGAPVGLYRDGSRMLPIVVRLPEKERGDFDRIEHMRLWSPSLQTYVPIQQVVSRVDIRWTDGLIMRRDRQRTLTTMASFDKFSGETAGELFERIRPGVEAIPLPPGYSLEWGGEYENSQRSLKGAFGKLPLALLLMFILTVLLFNSLRRSLVIWFTVPLALVGVAVGLLSTSMPLTFPAILGFLALIGMILKNGIVLVEQVMVELEAGKGVFDAVHDSAVSRVRPVSMAAATTVLAMVPLVTDPFFGSMAVVFIFGLGFATVLTLFVVPVLYLSLLGRSGPE
ncbi:efflux RND transporter permease subunit [Seongchinamella sediminis]|uniref:Efflux RND transporter permease subunit n=1 Tax=Seongchinamella sediminis TaxID=2283635 RepID=A0A3L7DTU9_9GAMM|nr:efflux RND transporter permease subunit [Seongchinamella sediminis]RLQ20516.1 efflux RND transporter permease subunit [Seongchinamella sediminis]